MPNDEHFEIMSIHNTLTKRRHQKQLLQQFSRQWKGEYLISLQEHSTTKSVSGKRSSIVVGDMVSRMTLPSGHSGNLAKWNS